MRDIFNSPTKEKAEEMAKEMIEKYRQKAPEFSKWLDSVVKLCGSKEQCI